MPRSTATVTILLFSILLTQQTFNVSHAQTQTDIRLLNASGSIENLPSVVRLLNQGANPNSVDKNGRTAVHYAAASAASLTGDTDVLQILLHTGGETDIRDKEGNTALHLAAKCSEDNNEIQSISSIQMLLGYGATPDLPNHSGTTALHLATKCHRSTEAIAALLKAGANTNRRTSEGFTPLLDAIWTQGSRTQAKVKIAEVLLNAGADPRITGPNGWTPLGAAVYKLSSDVVTLLISKGADPNRKIEGSPPLHEAVQTFFDTRNNFSLSTIEALLGGGADPNIADKDGYRALDLVAYNTDGTPAVLRALLEHGADPNVTPNHIVTQNPLTIAIVSGDLQAIETLLSFGADPTARNADGTTPFDISVALPSENEFSLLIKQDIAEVTKSSNRKDVTPLHFLLGMFAWTDEDLTDDVMTTIAVPSFRNSPDRKANSKRARALLDLGQDPNQELIQGWNALHVLTWYGDDEDTILEFIGAGADVNRMNREGATPLHHEIEKDGRLRVVGALLEAGADPTLKDSTGKAALHLAALHSEDAELGKALLEAGADVDATDSNDNTPLHFSAVKYSPGAASVLLSRGADPNSRNKFGRVPLHAASFWHAGAEMVAMLLNAGANVNVSDASGMTPLHDASSGLNNVAIVSALLGAGANPNATGADGVTPLHKASGTSDSTIVSSLLNAGANPNAMDIDGSTPLHIAAKSNKLAVIRMLLNSGADPNLTDIAGNTATKYASDLSVVRALRLVDQKAARIAREFEVEISSWAWKEACEGIEEQTIGVSRHACDHLDEYGCKNVRETYEEFLQFCEMKLQLCDQRRRAEVKDHEERLEREGRDVSLAQFAYSLSKVRIGGHLRYNRESGLHWELEC